MSDLYEHAKSEMDLAWPESEEMQDAVKRDVLQLIEVFTEQGHSFSSASYVAKLFYDLAVWKTIKPLTGEDDEWVKVGSDTEPLWQNKRCFSVFKRADGRAFDIMDAIFKDPDGNCVSSQERLDEVEESFVEVTFPYTPHTEYVEADHD